MLGVTLKREESLWHASKNWVVDYRDAQGRRHWETKPDKKTAQERLSEILKQTEPAALATDTRTVKEYAQSWLQNVAKTSIAESTYLEYEAVLRKHVYPVLGEIQFNKLARKQVRQWVLDKKAQGLSPSTIRNIVAPLRGMFNAAIDNEEHTHNPAANLGRINKAPKGSKRKIDPLTREEIQVLLQTALEKQPYYYPLLLCACRTGLRQGELLALKGIDVDFNGRFIHVQRSLSRRKIKAPKSGKARKVDMSSQLAGVFNELLSARRSKALQEEMIRSAEQRRDRDEVINEVMEDWLFQTPVIARSELAQKRRPGRDHPRGGTQLDPSNLRKTFNRLLTDAKLRRVRFHDLRHSFASLLIQQGESLAYIRDQLGHHSIQITVDTYGHLVPGGNRAAVDKLDQPVVAKPEQKTAVI